MLKLGLFFQFFFLKNKLCKNGIVWTFSSFSDLCQITSPSIHPVLLSFFYIYFSKFKLYAKAISVFDFIAFLSFLLIGSLFIVIRLVSEFSANQPFPFPPYLFFAHFTWNFKMVSSNILDRLTMCVRLLNHLSSFYHHRLSVLLQLTEL